MGKNILAHMNEIKHTPIMVKEIVDHVPQGCTSYLDGTAGHGGHIRAIIESGKLAPDAHIFAVDRDAIMLDKAQTILIEEGQNVNITKGKDICNSQFEITYIQDSYANIQSILGGEKVDFMLLDIGVNMEHFKDGSRGFSVHDNAPLDMRFDTRGGQTAADILNIYSQEKLEHIFIQYGDFAPSSATFFAKNIIEHRKTYSYKSTQDLIDSLYKIGVRKNQLPVIFQCLRIETNQELHQLEIFLTKFPETLSIGGRCAIITFHSTEDRIVKYAFKALEDTGDYKLVNKKVIIPHYTEVQKNRAARSAKLRIIEKVK